MSVLEIRWGLVPDMTGSQLLPELVGRDVAKELTFSGRVVRGEEAVALGLATRVDPDPRKAALELARSVAGRNPHAIRAAKRLLDLAGRVDLETGFAAEQEEIGALIGSPNQAEAVAAEFGKRPPRFTDPLTEADPGGIKIFVPNDPWCVPCSRSIAVRNATLVTDASLASRVAAGMSGELAVPPGARVESAPAAQPSAAASGRARPSSRPAIRPALKQSPAPVASTGVTGGRLTR